MEIRTSLQFSRDEDQNRIRTVLLKRVHQDTDGQSENTILSLSSNHRLSVWMNGQRELGTLVIRLPDKLGPYVQLTVSPERPSDPMAD